MPNTAQVNQPLIEHPLPYGIGRIVGASSTLVKGAAPSTDSLLVPPPPSSPNGSVSRGMHPQAPLYNNSPAEVLASLGNNFSLIYKAEGALEAILAADANALPVNGTLFLNPTALLLLAPTDRGIFLRLGALQEAGPVPFTGLLDAYTSYFDFRDRTRVAVDLTTDYQTVLSGVQGKSRLISGDQEGLDTLFAAIANFDSIAHVVEARLSDGVNTVTLPSAAVSAIPLGEVGALSINSLQIQEGWSLQLRLKVAVVDRPCRAILAYTDTNLAPVRSNQGGAY